MCYKLVNVECNFGVLSAIMLPPQAVNSVRHTVAMETLIGCSPPRRRETASRAYISPFETIHHFIECNLIDIKSIKKSII